MTLLMTRRIVQAPGISLPMRLYGPALLSGTATNLYVAWRKAQITGLHVSNPSASVIDLTLSIGSDAAGTRVYDDFAIAADWAGKIRCLYTLEDGEILQGFASTASVITLTVEGVEIT